MNIGEKLAIEESIKSHAEKQIANTEIISKIFNASRTQGISTGINSLDNIIGGLKIGNCIIIAGETGMGKSLLGINILTNVAKHNIPVCYLDLENGDAESIERVMGIWFEKEQSFFDDPSNIEKAIEMKATIDIYFRYYSHEDLLNYGYRENRLETLVRVIETEVKNGVKYFLVDPLQSITQADNMQNSFNAQGIFVETMKNLAQKHDLCILILHHIRKPSSSASAQLKATELEGGKDVVYKRPTKEDIKGSSMITDTATQVIGIVRPIYETNPAIREKLLVTVLKNRSGLLGDAKLKLNEKTFKITDRYSAKIQAFGNAIEEI